MGDLKSLLNRVSDMQTLYRNIAYIISQCKTQLLTGFNLKQRSTLLMLSVRFYRNVFVDYTVYNELRNRAGFRSAFVSGV